jgi:hypothetical protein
VCASATRSAGGSSIFCLDDEAADDGLEARDMLSVADLVRASELTMTEGIGEMQSVDSVVQSLVPALVTEYVISLSH